MSDPQKTKLSKEALIQYILRLSTEIKALKRNIKHSQSKQDSLFNKREKLEKSKIKNIRKKLQINTTP